MMTQHNKERHAAAMLVHQLGSGIEALDDLPHNIAIENYEALSQCLISLGDFLIRLGNIEEAKNEQLRMHQ